VYYLLLLEGAAKGDKFNPATITKDREYDVRLVDAPSANISFKHPDFQSNELRLIVWIRCEVLKDTPLSPREAMPFLTAFITSSVWSRGINGLIHNKYNFNADDSVCSAAKNQYAGKYNRKSIRAAAKYIFIKQTCMCFELYALHHEHRAIQIATFFSH
jgi:hypothetical protein